MIQETDLHKKINFLEILMHKMDQKGYEPNDIIYIEDYLNKLDEQVEDLEMKKKWDETQKDYDVHSKMILQVIFILNLLIMNIIQEPQRNNIL